MALDGDGYPMLELRGVTKLYSGIPAVRDVSFIARAGEVTGYLGPNGSGKSTTLKMITGLIEPSSGEILFDGQPIGRDRIAYKQRLGYVPEEPHLYPHLTGAEYLEMVGELRGLPGKRSPEKSRAFCACSRSMPTATCRSRRTRRACGKRCCWRRRCCTIPIWSCSTNRSPGSTSTPRWSCAA